MMKHSCPVLSASRVNRQCVCEPETLIEQLYGTTFSLEWALEGFSLYTEQPRVYNCHVQNNNKTPTDNTPTLDNIPDHTPWHHPLTTSLDHTSWQHFLTTPLDHTSWQHSLTTQGSDNYVKCRRLWGEHEWGSNALVVNCSSAPGGSFVPNLSSPPLLLPLPA